MLFRVLSSIREIHYAVILLLSNETKCAAWRVLAQRWGRITSHGEEQRKPSHHPSPGMACCDPTIRAVDVVTEISLHSLQRRLSETVRWSEVIRDGTRGVESGEILLGKLLNGCNHVPEFLSFFSEMLLDARRDLQESSPLHEPHLFQDPEPLCECLRTDMSHERSQFVEAFWTSQQVGLVKAIAMLVQVAPSIPQGHRRHASVRRPIPQKPTLALQQSIPPSKRNALPRSSFTPIFFL